MGRVATYAEWRRRPLGDIVEPSGLDRDRARQIVDAALGTPVGPDGGLLLGRTHVQDVTDAGGDDEPSGGGSDGPSPGGEDQAAGDGARWLTSAEPSPVLRAYGVPLARSRVVATAEEGATTQEAFGGPVAVKIAAPIHKTDVGGIELGLETPGETAAAIERIRTALIEADLGEHADSFLVQEMVGDGIEMAVGVTHDPSFGPIVMAGMGGTLVELLRDVSVRITPLTDQDVDDMLATLRMAPLLTGYRGSPPADVGALKDLLFRINAMVEDLPEVAELDLNPVFVRPDGEGVVAVDVRMKVAPVL
jgi:acetate---CoA ligase (ADP-forming)